MLDQQKINTTSKFVNNGVVYLSIIFSALVSLSFLVYFNKFVELKPTTNTMYSYENFLIPLTVGGVCKRYIGDELGCMSAKERGLSCLWYPKCQVCQDTTDLKIPKCNPK